MSPSRPSRTQIAMKILSVLARNGRTRYSRSSALAKATGTLSKTGYQVMNNMIEHELVKFDSDEKLEITEKGLTTLENWRWILAALGRNDELNELWKKR